MGNNILIMNGVSNEQVRTISSITRIFNLNIYIYILILIIFFCFSPLAYGRRVQKSQAQKQSFCNDILMLDGKNIHFKKSLSKIMYFF